MITFLNLIMLFEGGFCKLPFLRAPSLK